MLVDVIMHEKPEVESQRKKLSLDLANFKEEIVKIEKEILSLLAKTDPDKILDEDTLINVLEASKNKAHLIQTELANAMIIEENVKQTRDSYKQISERGSVIYFVIADLAGIDPMYQYSLTYVKKLFNIAIANSEKSDVHEKNIELLLNAVTYFLFTNVS